MTTYVIFQQYVSEYTFSISHIRYAYIVICAHTALNRSAQIKLCACQKLSAHGSVCYTLGIRYNMYIRHVLDLH